MKITYKNIFATFVALGMVFLVRPASAATLTLDPWTYDPDSTGTVVSEDQGGDLLLEKNAPTPTNSAAGAEILGVAGMSTNDLTLQFDYEGYCGAGAPRLNVYLTNGTTVFLGCLHGDSDADGTATFVSGETYGGVLFPTGETISGLDIVMDEEGQTTLSNVMVNDTVVNFEVVVLPPTDKNQCKNSGWMVFNNPSFKNQGDCVSYVQSSEKAKGNKKVN